MVALRLGALTMPLYVGSATRVRIFRLGLWRGRLLLPCRLIDIASGERKSGVRVAIARMAHWCAGPAAAGLNTFDFTMISDADC